MFTEADPIGLAARPGLGRRAPPTTTRAGARRPTSAPPARAATGRRPAPPDAAGAAGPTHRAARPSRRGRAAATDGRPPAAAGRGRRAAEPTGLLANSRLDGGRQPGQPGHRLPAQHPAASPRSAPARSATPTTAATTFPNMVYELLLGGVLSSVLIPLLVHAQDEDDDGGVAYTQRLLSIATAALGVDDAGRGGRRAADRRGVRARPARSAAHQHLRHAAAAGDLLLRPRRDVHGRAQHPAQSTGPAPGRRCSTTSIMIVTVGVFWALPGPEDAEPVDDDHAADPRPRHRHHARHRRAGARPDPVAAAHRLPLAVALPGPRRTRSAGCGRSARSPAGCSATSSSARSASRSSRRVGNDNGGFTVFTNADLLFQMPYGILVVSLLTAIMPRLSRAAVRGDTAAVVGDLSLGARLSAVALVPITAGLIVLGPGRWASTLFAYGETSIARRPPDRLGAGLVGVRAVPVRAGDAAAAGVLRDARRPDPDADQRRSWSATKVVLVLVTNAMFAVPRAPTSTAPVGARGRVAQHLDLAVLRRRRGRRARRCSPAGSGGWASAPVLRTVAADRRRVGGRRRWPPAAWSTARTARCSGGAHGGSVAGLVRRRRWSGWPCWPWSPGACASPRSARLARPLRCGASTAPGIRGVPRIGSARSRRGIEKRNRDPAPQRDHRRLRPGRLHRGALHRARRPRAAGVRGRRSTAAR